MAKGPCKACNTMDCHHRRAGRARAAKADALGARSMGGTFRGVRVALELGMPEGAPAPRSASKPHGGMSATKAAAQGGAAIGFAKLAILSIVLLVLKVGPYVHVEGMAPALLVVGLTGVVGAVTGGVLAWWYVQRSSTRAWGEAAARAHDATRGATGVSPVMLVAAGSLLLTASLAYWGVVA